MKFTPLPVWAALALAGGLLAAPPAQANTGQANTGAAPPAVTPLLPVPSRLAATGLARPIGSQVQLSWTPVPRARGYKVYRDGRFLALSGRAFWADYAVAAGETHAYAVAGLGPAGESGPSAPATATVPADGGQVVYADALENGWQSWSWAGLDPGSTDPVRAGCAVRVAAGPWQALYLHHAPFSTSAYAAVTFWIHGGSRGGQRLWVKALRSGVPQAAVPLGPLPAGQWQSVTVPLRDLGVAGVPDMDGLWVQDASGTTPPAFSVDEIALTAAPPAPAAPAGLTATPQWAASCPKCGGMAMAHVVLAWNAVPGASSYAVSRDGAQVQDGLAAPAWTDMAVVSGRAYAYTVTATGPGGESARSLPASATAPQPPAGQALIPPTNLAVHSFWQGAPSDTLTWDAVPGAVSYNVYQYDVLLAKGLTNVSYTLPFNLFNGSLTYTVTTVDSMGMESLPSAAAAAQGHYDPASRPSWMPDPPCIPTALAATPEWNAGAPRIHLIWHGKNTDFTYNVYRDGQQVASGLWGLNYYDPSVKPGETHAYAVSGVNLPWTVYVESAPGDPVTATALSAAPTASGVPVQITDVKANDDSALVSFAAVPGALDYRVYDLAHPNSVKYSGGSLSIEMNGLDPAAGADLVVEAVDKLGPFQTMDGMAGPGAMQMDGMHSAINGQGDPSNIPLVLAKSDVFHVTCQPMSLTGSQVFFDNFRASLPFTPAASLDPALAARSNPYNEIKEVENDKWHIRSYGMDTAMSRLFTMGSHFMDTVYDGPTAATMPFSHNNNASVVMMPNATADISGGKVLHVTFEVDAHMDARRWCDVFVGPAGDTLVDPGKFADFVGRRPTLSGRLFRWEIQVGAHSLNLFPGVKPDANSDEIPLTHQQSGVGPDSFGICARSGPWCAIPFNGTPGDLDKRHKFDLYLSKNRAVIMEQGRVVKDAPFPDGATLPFDKCQVYFVHQLYHTSNDRQELLDFGAGADPYWYNYRSWGDERHWDSLGESVLDTFPSFSSSN